MYRQWSKELQNMEECVAGTKGLVQAALEAKVGWNQQTRLNEYFKTELVCFQTRH